MAATGTAPGTGTVPFYAEADVQAVLTLDAVTDAVESALVAKARGTARNIAKTMTTWTPPSSAHALGAIDLDTGLVAFKTWVNTPGGAAATITVHDAGDGALIAAVSAGALGALRTAAISAVATRWRAHPDADELAIIGTGRQALAQVQAVHTAPGRAPKVSEKLVPAFTGTAEGGP
jgi:ornithine cyclodeaminase